MPPDGITTAIDTFVGYLLLDAWIGNGDRHHENWRFIATVDPQYRTKACKRRVRGGFMRITRFKNETPCTRLL
jgi:hypothetical protein